MLGKVCMAACGEWPKGQGFVRQFVGVSGS